MSYEFNQGLNDILLSIISWIYAADEYMAENNITGSLLQHNSYITAYQHEFVAPIMVRGPARGKSEPEVTTIPILVEIEPNTPEPLGVVKFKATDYWNVNIKLPPMDPKVGGNCFYMGLCIPRQMAAATPINRKVMISWVYQIMIDPMNHTQVAPAVCLGPDVPNYQWGTLFMQLFETINKLLAYHIQPQALLLSGLVDDAFVQYCGHPVVFSDLRRFQGQAPWYEGFGYKMANLEEYTKALNASTYYQARDSVEQHYQEYIRKLNACKSEALSYDEKQTFCRNDPVCTNLQSRQEVARYIAEAIRNNDEQRGCSWISDSAPLTCLTQFNRHHNPQTLRLKDETGNVEEVVLRLKFY